MKKCLFVPIFLAIVLQSAQSSCPPLSDHPILYRIYDVVIGDCDDRDFWTTDVNFFRFSNAFRFDDFIKDTVTTPSLLSWCFIEQVPGFLEINGKLSLDRMTEDPYNPPPSKDIRAGNTWASFRDIMASPHSYDAAVQAGSAKYPGAPLCDQFITFWVSDGGDNVDSGTIYVKSIDCGIDRLSAGWGFIPYFDFDTGPGNWSFSPFTGFSLPASDFVPSAIGLSGPAEGNVFGFWETPSDEIAYQANRVFRARYWLMRDPGITNPDDMPTIRLRWTAHNFAGSAAYYINSTSTFDMVPPIAPDNKQYRSYFYGAADTGGLGLTFDMLDFSPTEHGLVQLDCVSVDKIDTYFLDLGAVALYTFDTNFDTWEFNPNFGTFGDISFAPQDPDRITLTSTVADAFNAGFAQCPADVLAYNTSANYLYRASFEISREGTDPMEFPYVRLRAFNEDNQIVAEYNIIHGNAPGPGAPPQTPATKAFEMYWETPDLPPSPTTEQDGFRVAIDMLDFSALEGDSAYLEKVDIEYMEIPPIPGYW